VSGEYRRGNLRRHACAYDTHQPTGFQRRFGE
jgi:hypothetical protein